MKKLLETQIQPDVMEKGIRAFADEIVTMIEDITKDEADLPVFDQPKEIKFDPRDPDGMVDYVGHVKNVPNDVRKKFQAKFRRRHKSEGYYRRVTNGRKDVAYGFAWMLDDGTWAQASLYDYRCSQDVEFILCAAPSGPSDRNMKDHDFFWSADPFRDADAISENVAQWAGDYGRRHYAAVTVWQPHKCVLRIGDAWNNYNFYCYSVESFSLENSECVKTAASAVVKGLQRAGMPFRVYKDIPEHDMFNALPGACGEDADRSHHNDLAEIRESRKIMEIGRDFMGLMR